MGIVEGIYGGLEGWEWVDDIPSMSIGTKVYNIQGIRYVTKLSYDKTPSLTINYQNIKGWNHMKVINVIDDVTEVELFSESLVTYSSTLCVYTDDLAERFWNEDR